MPAIIGSFEYSGTDYLDKRVSFSSLTALETQTDIKFPNGFECWCESEQTWYQLSTTNPDDISTYIWSERPSGDATIIVDGVQTSDYKFVINRSETEAAYGDVANAILQQVTSMFTSLQDTINKQNNRINTLELEIENLKAQIGGKPITPIVTGELIDYNGDTLVDYNNFGIGGYPEIKVEGELVDYSGNTLVDYNNYGIGGYLEIKVEGELVDYSGNTLVDYNNYGIGGYVAKDNDNLVYLTDYNGNILADYNDNTISDYTEILDDNVVCLTDYNGNILVDYNNNIISDYTEVLDDNFVYVTDVNGNILTDYEGNYLIDFTDNNTYLIDTDNNYVIDYNQNKIII